MRKPAKPLTRPEKAILLERTAYVSPFGSPETLNHMKDCEAREWMARYKKRAGEVGAVPAQSWWAQVCSDIERRRGAAALNDLRDRMNNQRKLKNV